MPVPVCARLPGGKSRRWGTEDAIARSSAASRCGVMSAMAAASTICTIRRSAFGAAVGDAVGFAVVGTAVGLPVGGREGEKVGTVVLGTTARA